MGFQPPPAPHTHRVGLVHGSQLEGKDHAVQLCCGGKSPSRTVLGDAAQCVCEDLADAEGDAAAGRVFDVGGGGGGGGNEGDHLPLCLKNGICFD